jgi:hypothetical protein
MAEQEVRPANSRLRGWVAEAIVVGAKLLKPVYFRTYCIRPADLVAVGNKVHQQKIGVFYVPDGLPKNAAAYYIGEKEWNGIFVGPSAAGGNEIEVRGVMLHEAVHAAHDMYKQQMHVYDDESMAHIVEMMYNVKRRPGLKRQNLNYRHYRRAFDAVIDHLDQGRATKETEKRLRDAIGLYYAAEGKKNRGIRAYNGVPGKMPEKKGCFPPPKVKPAFK